jgi:hypothetical protein
VAEKKDDNDANQHRGKRHLALHVLVPAEEKYKTKGISQL